MRLRTKYRFYSLAILVANILVFAHTVLFHSHNLDHSHLHSIFLKHNVEHCDICNHHNHEHQNGHSEEEGDGCGCCSHGGAQCSIALGYFSEESRNKDIHISVDLVATLPDNFDIVFFDNFVNIIHYRAKILPIEDIYITEHSLRAPPVYSC